MPSSNYIDEPGFINCQLVYVFSVGVRFDQELHCSLVCLRYYFNELADLNYFHYVGFVCFHRIQYPA